MANVTIDGVVYEETPDGRLKAVAYANQSPAPITIGTPNKVKVAKDAAELQGTQLNNQSKTATAPYDARKAAAEATKAEADAQAAVAAGRDKPIMDPKVAEAVKNLGIDELLASVAAARREVGTGRATGITGAFGRMVPGSSANDLSGSLNSIQGAVIMEKLQQLKDASKTGASGMGALSEREGQRLADSIAALGTNLSDPKLLEGLSTVERHARALQAVAAGENPDDPAIAKKYGIVVDKPRDPPPLIAAGSGAGPASGGGGGQLPGALGGPSLALSAGQNKIMGPDPALAGVTSKMQAMIKAGRSGDEIRAYLDQVQPGLGGKVNNLDSWIKWHNANPSLAITITPPQLERPLTAAEGFDNYAAQSPVGAALMGAGDMMSGGTLDNMSANPALARAGMAGVAQANPKSNFAGQVVGAIGAGLGAEMGAGALGVGKLGAILAGDILPGAIYGAGSADDGSRLFGAAEGGIAGLVGGATGRAAGRVISGVTDGAVKRLSDAGVSMTLPQMLGGAWKGAEDRLSGMPGLRGIINGARTRGLEDGNRAVLDQAVVAPLAALPAQQIGEAGVNNLADTVSQGYQQALGGKSVQIDPTFTQQWGHLSQAVPSIPNVGQELQAGIAQNVGPMFQNGVLSGESMQAVDRGLADLKSKYVDHPLFATHIAPAIDAAGDAVTGMFERQAPEVMPAYNAAKATYRNLSTISDAVNAGIQTNGTFTAAQLGTAARANAKKFGSAINAAKGNRPFFQLQRDMQNVLPSKIPDPGTAGQMVIPGTLALLGGGGGAATGYGNAGDMTEGGGIGAVGGLGIAGALASPYLARSVLQKILTANRPQTLKIGGDIIGRARIPGALALPLLTPSGQ
jgi:hypothetical protein